MCSVERDLAQAGAILTAWTARAILPLGGMSKTWFITGTSRGLGREWARAALARGDRVAGAARTVGGMDDLRDEYGQAVLPLELDVTNREACFAAVNAAHDHFGRLDVIVNNAGYGQRGMVEEVGERDVRDLIDTNLFGALWITQAALPFLRQQRSGHIVQVSSVGGISAFPGIGLYCASKWALEGMSQALAAEVSTFGIRVTLIEPGGFATGNETRGRQAPPLDAYASSHEAARALASERRSVLGDPTASAQAVLRIVDAEDPPLRVFFGSAWLGVAIADYEGRLATWRKWQPVSELAEGSSTRA
jgi:NAD(P)-dependent dehydrogenase (short-subunit alcohol dehydrogenase family)